MAWAVHREWGVDREHVETPICEIVMGPEQVRRLLTFIHDAGLDRSKIWEDEGAPLQSFVEMLSRQAGMQRRLPRIE